MLKFLASFQLDILLEQSIVIFKNVQLHSFLFFTAELGDYDPRRHLPGYAAEFNFIANQTTELESKASEIHKGLW